MSKKKRLISIISFVSIAIILAAYVLSIVFAIMGNVGLTATIIAFNTVFVVIVYFILRFHKNRLADEALNEEAEENQESQN